MEYSTYAKGHVLHSKALQSDTYILVVQGSLSQMEYAADG